VCSGARQKINIDDPQIPDCSQFYAKALFGDAFRMLVLPCRSLLGGLRRLLRNSRKTERGAKQFLIRMAVRAAPFALLTV
jgi:hypothetical protein